MRSPHPARLSRHRLVAEDAELPPRRRRFESDCRDHLAESCLSPVRGRSAKPQHCACTQSQVQILHSPPKLVKELNYRALCAFLRALFQYGLLHLGHTLGSPIVDFRGTHAWRQRVHLYPFC